jgi:SAM-dependent methyltransferase
MREAWDDHASQWAVWARTPGHDHFFWDYNLPRFLEILPPPGELTVEVGCGEGRVARALTDLGHHVVGLDASPTLASLAATHGEQPVSTAVADAAALPLPSAVADRAVAFMSLQDVDDLADAVDELGRVLRPGGILCVAILHPLTTVGEFADDSIDADFVVTHPYRAPRRFVDHVERDGLTMEFHSIHRPLAAYTDAVHRAGFVIDDLREPVPDAAAIARFPRLERQDRMPWYLHLRATRTAAAPAVSLPKGG